MSQPLTIFLDDGGVMNDNDVRGREWQRLVGEYLAPRLGGAAETWAEANRVVFDRQWQRFERLRDDEARQPVDYVGFFETRAEWERWLREMCEEVGVAAPQGDDCYRLAIETESYVVPRVHSAFPDAIEAVRALHASGARLSTASGESSRDLERYLKAMSIRELFGQRLYGPDVVGAAKPTCEFYRRLFTDAEAEPSAAVVVDDTARALDNAAAAGARTVLVSRDGAGSTASHYVVHGLDGLLALLPTLERGAATDA